MMVRKAKRILDLKKLPARTDEGHRLAKEAMAPFLPEFQAAADEQTKADFGVDVDAVPSAPRVTCPECKGTSLVGDDGGPGDDEPCPMCGGSGTIAAPPPVKKRKRAVKKR